MAEMTDLNFDVKLPAHVTRSRGEAAPRRVAGGRNTASQSAAKYIADLPHSPVQSFALPISFDTPATSPSENFKPSSRSAVPEVQKKGKNYG
jgi:hypothetical protein